MVDIVIPKSKDLTAFIGRILEQVEENFLLIGLPEFADIGQVRDAARIKVAQIRILIEGLPIEAVQV